MPEWVEEQRVQANNKQVQPPEPPEAKTSGRRGDRTIEVAFFALPGASDWEWSLDLERKVLLPQDVAVTTSHHTGSSPPAAQ